VSGPLSQPASATPASAEVMKNCLRAMIAFLSSPSLIGPS
jgi:hypothetical protein